MADNHTIARPYAQALFDVANESGSLDQWSQSLDVAAQLLASGEVADFLSNPSLNDDQCLKFLTGLFAKAGSEKLSGKDLQGRNFLKLLIENNRIDTLPEITAHFADLKAKVENTVDVTVTSATPISPEQLARISSALKDRLGRDIRVETKLDENLIGGAVIRAGDIVIDGSVRARLNGLAQALVN